MSEPTALRSCNVSSSSIGRFAAESKRDKEESTATTSSDDTQAREVRIVASGGGGGGDKPPLSESEDGKEIILQGFLKKQTHSRFTKYKKRWCMLSADSLTYYENKVRHVIKFIYFSNQIK
jgi:hypothetical protein